MINLKKFWICSFSLLMLTSCTLSKSPKVSQNAETDTKTTMPPERDLETIKKATASIYPTIQQSINASGTVTFTEENGGIRVTANLIGLKPGEHGFHIHQYGDCSKDGEAAGLHYSSSDKIHGAPKQELVHHKGDLGNITADQAGNAHYDEVIPDLNLHFILGRSIVVHEKADDFKTQPSGNSGKRIACGVIGLISESEANSENTNTQKAQ